jgi:hypothetical protein
MAKSLNRFSGVLWILSALIGIWISLQIYEMSQRYDRLPQLYLGNLIPVLPASEVKHRESKLPICVPLLPVKVWNRDSTEVPNPPRWRRRFV